MEHGKMEAKSGGEHITFSCAEYLGHGVVLGESNCGQTDCKSRLWRWLQLVQEVHSDFSFGSC
jgi:hypothetical protein